LPPLMPLVLAALPWLLRCFSLICGSRSSNCYRWFIWFTWLLITSRYKMSWSVTKSNSPGMKCRLLEAKNVHRGCFVWFFTRCCTLFHFMGNSCQWGLSRRPEKILYTPSKPTCISHTSCVL
jgi:hypothetical protein